MTGDGDEAFCPLDSLARRRSVDDPLPSGGDNSYPGFVLTSPDRALVSYYSSHERDPSGKTITAIYLAQLELQD
jgi:hypothetical protein